MKKKILILVVGLLLMGANAFAAGDLIVNGKLGVGTSSPAGKLHVYSENESTALSLSSIMSVRPQYITNIGASYSIQATETGIDSTRYTGYKGESILMGSGYVKHLIGAENVVVFNASTNGSTVEGAKGNTAILRRGSLNTKNHTLTTYYGYHSYGQAAGSGNIGGTDWRHAYFEDFPNYGGIISGVAGLWIDRQTRGTNNYGLVLDGNGAGADIVMGPNQETRIYSAQEVTPTNQYLGIWVEDSGGNATQISPHDPETGEWIFYSKNVKTGRTVRVNMEKLVKAIEKLTGETFMVESLMEDK